MECVAETGGCRVSQSARYARGDGMARERSGREGASADVGERGGRAAQSAAESQAEEAKMRLLAPLAL